MSRPTWDEDFLRPERKHWLNNAVFLVPPGLGSLVRILTIVEELGAQTITVHAALLNDPRFMKLARVARAMDLTIEIHSELPNYWGEGREPFYGCDWHPDLKWAHPHIHRHDDGRPWRADPPDYRSSGSGLLIYGSETYQKRMESLLRIYRESSAGALYIDGLASPIGIPTMPGYGDTTDGRHLIEEVGPVLEMKRRLVEIDPNVLLGAAAGAPDIYRAPITHVCPYVSPSDFRHELSFTENVIKLERELREKIETYCQPEGARVQRARFGWMPLHLTKNGVLSWIDVKAAAYFRERVMAMSCPWWVQLHVDTWWDAPQRQAVSVILKATRHPGHRNV